LLELVLVSSAFALASFAFVLLALFRAINKLTVRAIADWILRSSAAFDAAAVAAAVIRPIVGDVDAAAAVNGG
jgi:hypothetical protein